MYFKKTCHFIYKFFEVFDVQTLESLTFCYEKDYAKCFWEMCSFFVIIVEAFELRFESAESLGRVTVMNYRSTNFSERNIYIEM